MAFDGILQWVRERESSSICSSASSLEFIASLQEQARKLSDKKINGILLDPFLQMFKIPDVCAEKRGTREERKVPGEDTGGCGGR